MARRLKMDGAATSHSFFDSSQASGSGGGGGGGGVRQRATECLATDPSTTNPNNCPTSKINSITTTLPITAKTNSMHTPKYSSN
ncbi:hypothetical protein CCACVL1_19579 [Corchorus capsularis]|uniref:Uncharacterized protein n=1 Tax=Corchorus capsularis TaxID=210143 RepID=A0A1R3HG29_COCAP|nr:hypothetical protein CCACVL1_19579 [Corchorus capsularis]